MFVSPSAAPYSVRDKLKPEEMELLKVMQTQGILCASAQTHLSFLQPPVPLAPDFPATTTASERLSPSLSPQLTLSKRFDVSQQALDLRRLCDDPGTADSSNSRVGEGRGVFLEGDLGMVTWEGLVLAPDPTQPSDSLPSPS